MKAQFQDHFSERAPGYAQYRPHYPRELAGYLAEQTKACTDRNSPLTVWEAGCGSGQLTAGLAERFERVIATDASADQIAHARPVPHGEYRIARAEACGLPDDSIDLAVSAQAAHWFELEGYYQEVRRVVRPGGLIAMVVYGIHVTDDSDLDRVVMRFYRQTLERYWPPQRRLVEEGYRTLPFPFDEIRTPTFEMREEWSLDELLGYVETWSATTALAKSAGRKPIDEFRSAVASVWGDPAARRLIRWPLSVRLGRIQG